jgi:hypothetical protein
MTTTQSSSPIRAPELSGAIAWLNVPAPLSLKALRGKVVLLDPETGQVKTLAGTGKPGHADGPGRQAQFYEPGGLSVSGETIFVADTNNHCVRVVDVASGATTTLLLNSG